MTKISYKFSNCNKVGNVGPTQEEADVFYKSSNVRVKIVGSGIQKWRVPYSGVYYIEAAGAKGTSACSDYSGGKGVRFLSIFTLYKRDTLFILVGQQNFPPDRTWGGPGGGGSYVAKKELHGQYIFKPDDSFVRPLIVAAGGAGAGDCNEGGSPKNGDEGHCEFKEEAGGLTGQLKSSGGAGFASNAENNETKSFLNGGIGSLYSVGYGGFGGGGCPEDAGGGGGGYKGGDSGATGYKGMGGYSYSKTMNISCVSGANAGAGSIIIQFIKSDVSINSCSKKIPIHMSLFLMVFMHVK